MSAADLDRDAKLVRAAGKLLICRECHSAFDVLREVDSERHDRPPRPQRGADPPVIPAAERAEPLTDQRELEVLRRDRWTCCYCQRLIIHAKVLEAIGRLAGEVFPFVNHRLPKNKTHPAIERLYPNVEHVLPRSRGGGNEDANLRACCTPCNEWKGNRTLEEAQNARAEFELHEPGEGWDGLEPMLGPLLKVLEHCSTKKGGDRPPANLDSPPPEPTTPRKGAPVDETGKILRLWDGAFTQRDQVEVNQLVVTPISLVSTRRLARGCVVVIDEDRMKHLTVHRRSGDQLKVAPFRSQVKPHTIGCDKLTGIVTRILPRSPAAAHESER